MLRPVAGRRRLPRLAACPRSGSAEGKCLGLKRPPAGLRADLAALVGLREAPARSPCCAGAPRQHWAVAAHGLGGSPEGPR